LQRPPISPPRPARRRPPRRPTSHRFPRQASRRPL
jgi:hypothetical protein